MTHARERKQEDHRLPSGRVLLVLVGILTVFFLMGLTSWLILRGNNAQLRLSDDWQDRRLSAPPEEATGRGVIFSEVKSAAERNDRNRQLLNSYRWIDRTKGVFHIPIDRAMELVVEASQ